MGSKPGDLKFKTSNLLYRSWLRRSQIRGEESDNTPAFMLTLAESRPAEFFHRIWPELVAARPGLPGCHRTENRWSWKNWRACSSPSTPFDPSSWPWTLGLSPWPTTASPEGLRSLAVFQNRPMWNFSIICDDLDSISMRKKKSSTPIFDVSFLSPPFKVNFAATILGCQHWTCSKIVKPE